MQLIQHDVAQILEQPHPLGVVRKDAGVEHVRIGQDDVSPLASRKPLANLSLIWFTVWSSIVHAGIMAAQALSNPEHMGHLLGDVPALLMVAGVLALLTPRGAAAKVR